MVAIESTSSIKIIEGAFSQAILNTSQTIFGPSPRYFYTNSEPTTEIKVALVSVATALAIIVLPVPGGPYIRTPLGASIPNFSNNSGCLSGNSIASLISYF